MPQDEEIAQRFEIAVQLALGASRRPASPDCLTPEVIAAYYVYALKRVERSRCEAHISQCARCKETLDTLIRAKPEEQLSPESAARVAEAEVVEPGSPPPWRLKPAAPPAFDFGRVWRIVGPSIAALAIIAAVIFANVHPRQGDERGDAAHVAAVQARARRHAFKRPRTARRPSEEDELALNEGSADPAEPAAPAAPFKAAAPSAGEAAAGGAPSAPPDNVYSNPLFQSTSDAPRAERPRPPAAHASVQEKPQTLNGQAQPAGAAQTQTTAAQAMAAQTAAGQPAQPSAATPPQVTALAPKAPVAAAPAANAAATGSGPAARMHQPAPAPATAPTVVAGVTVKQTSKAADAASAPGRAPSTTAIAAASTALDQVAKAIREKTKAVSALNAPAPAYAPKGHVEQELAAAKSLPDEPSSTRTEKHRVREQKRHLEPRHHELRRPELVASAPRHPAIQVAQAKSERATSNTASRAVSPARRFASRARVPSSTATADLVVATSSVPVAVLPAVAPVAAGIPVPPRAALIASPDNSVYWSLQDFGIIYRSTDRTSWVRFSSGTQQDLLAGAAPSHSVCWAVGKHGAIVLTKDAVHWTRLRSPTNADLVGVIAASADVATVVARDGERFSTFDGGSNWQAGGGEASAWQRIE